MIPRLTGSITVASHNPRKLCQTRKTNTSLLVRRVGPPNSQNFEVKELRLVLSGICGGFLVKLSATVISNCNKKGSWKRGNCVKFGFLALTFLSSCCLWRPFGHLCSSVTSETEPCCTTEGSKFKPAPLKPSEEPPQCGNLRKISAKCGNCRKLCFSHPGRQTL